MDSCVLSILYYIRVPVGIKHTVLLYHVFFLLFSVSCFLSKGFKVQHAHTGPGLNPAESLWNESYTIPGEKEPCKFALAIELLLGVTN